MAQLFGYALTLLPPSVCNTAIVGQFSGSKQQEILVSHGSWLELLRMDPASKKMATVLHHEVFGIIRSLMPFRLAGSPKDYIVIGSDSGRIVTMEYLPDKNIFAQIHCETYGKSGVRRVVPGQFIAVDPKGRACLIASIEKNKLVYVLNRDAQLNLTISSPLEAHKPGAIVFAVTGLDVGYENPIFAALEVDYTEVDQDPTGQQYETLPKTMVYYELDLGLNHVVRKWSDVVDRRSNFLLAVPGGTDGPGGILVGTEDFIYYKHQNKETFRIPIPKRTGIPHADKSQARKNMIITGVMHKMKQTFFSLVQNENGDIFKITFVMSDDRRLTGLKIKYFDTVPPATALCILKSGYLYTATEFGNQMVYKFEKLGDDDNEIEFLSDDYAEDAMQFGQKALFTPRPLENLSIADEIVAMNPIMGSKVVNLTGEDAPQIYTINGSGARSSFRKLVHGLDVNELATTSSEKPVEGVWTTKITAADQSAKYIVLSYAGVKETTVLSIGESVEALPDSQTHFISKARTLAVQQMGDDLLVQVHESGMRLIKPGGTVDWKAPTHRTIRQVATNSRQVVLFLSNGELAYFRYLDGELQEYGSREKFDNNITSLAIAEVPEGRILTEFLAVGADDNTVQIISLDERNTLERLSIQALSALPTSLCIVAMEDITTGRRMASTLYLHIGLENGLYLRTILDTTDGSLADTRRRFLGTKAVKLVQIEVQKQSCVMAMSSRSWLAYNQSTGLSLTPLSYPPLDAAWRFSNEDWGVEEGIVGVEGVNLRIFSIDQLNNNLKQEIMPLSYTPRRLIQHPHRPLFYILETDHNTSPLPKTQTNGHTNGANGDVDGYDAVMYGLPKTGQGNWASCIRVIDPLSKETLFRVDLDENEGALCGAVVHFSNKGDDLYLCVGTCKGVSFNPPNVPGAFIHAYLISTDGRSLQLIHKTPTELPPGALLGFQGKLLAGVGKSLRLYEMGLQRLLRKHDSDVLIPSLEQADAKCAHKKIVDLQTQGSRVMIADVQESVSFATYKHIDNKFLVFCDDFISRWTTASIMMDYDTIAGGDKFGNIWVVRCPPEVSTAADDDIKVAQMMHEKTVLHGVPHKLELLSHYFLNDIPTGVHRTRLVAGGRDVLLYTGLMGTVGIYIPFVSRDDIDFFQQLETHLRAEDQPIAGRDHMIYRGYYVPVKGTIDGDLCERYGALPLEKQRRIANELDRSIAEVQKKIEDMRVRVAY